MSAKNPRTSKGSPRAGAKSARPSALRRFWLPAVLLLALAAGGLTGIVIAYELNYSKAAGEVASLATYRPSQVTRVYADDGKTVIGEFALERRIPLRYEEIPPVLKNAILAVEDARFYDHIGIDPIRIVGAAWKNITADRREGGSTLTQQLTKNLFLSREQTLTRKFNEWLIAIQIERFYTKNQIMEMYVNHVFLGARAYGFEAASETYFGKQAKDLTLDEAALLAGIPRSTSKYSPTVSLEAAKERRDLVLQLMANNGFIAQADADAAKTKPVKLADTAYYPPPSASHAWFEYPVEEVRQYIEDKYTTRVAFGGLSVYTTINPAAQKKAYEAVRAGLRTYDKGHRGWRSAYEYFDQNQSAPATPQALASVVLPEWFGNNYEADTWVRGLVTNVDRVKNEATVRFGGYTATVTSKDMGWSNRQPRDELKPGYICEFKINSVDKEARRLTVDLAQTPDIQGALYSLNAKTGEVIAMVGGYNFYTNKFNCATQAYRQTGSAFKPFIYTAAVEWGLTPDSVISGAQIKRGDWIPHNYDGATSCADVPMKVALAHSLNIPAVHLLDMVGIQTGAQMVRRFGITVPMAPYLPSALGATEVPLDQMVSAYSAFPNKGIRVQPHLVVRVLDRDGAPLEEWERTTYKVISQYVALTMVQLMRGPVEMAGGTATAARAAWSGPIAGKTGTVNDHTDVWFMGYTPTYVTGVWLGYPDRKKNLGTDMTGGHGALPIWVEYMKDWLKDKPKEQFDKAPSMPEDIKELQQQRQRELAEERAAETAQIRADKDQTDTNADGTAPHLDTITLPPAPGEVAPGGDTSAPRRAEPVVAPHVETDAPPPPVQVPPPATRPREVEPNKKKGKKGTDDTPPPR
jgi:penicillin-binding protein 1A